LNITAGNNPWSSDFFREEVGGPEDFHVSLDELVTRASSAQRAGIKAVFAHVLKNAAGFVYGPPRQNILPGRNAGKAPLFPDLATVLRESFEVAPLGAECVVVNVGYRKAADTPSSRQNGNLRTQFGRISKRAGLKP
jgi:hypothetical protein